MSEKNRKVEVARGKVSEKAEALMQELIAENTKLILEVATCDCDKASECGVFKRAKKIAMILKEIQNAR